MLYNGGVALSMRERARVNICLLLLENSYNEVIGLPQLILNSPQCSNTGKRMKWII